MKKNLSSVLLSNLIKDITSVIMSDDKNTDWLDKMIKDSELSIDDLLNESNDKDWDDKLKTATDLMNKNIEKAVEKVNKNERKVLIDRPINVKGDKMKSNKEELCDCGCGKPVDECSCSETKAKTSKLNVENAFTADSLRKASKVKLINVNKTAEKILSTIYSEIKANSSKNYIEYDFMDERWDKLLLNVRAVTVEKVLNRVADNLIDNGFSVSFESSYDNDSLVGLSFTIAW